MSEPLLFEIGCEEIPARMIAAAAEDLCARVTAVLDAAGVTHGAARAWGGTRRLAVRVESVAGALPGKDELVLGPAASSAFKEDGTPAPAGAGFAKKQGIDPAALQKFTTEKGVYAGFRRQVAERTLAEVLAAALPASVAAMSFPKTMRWGSGTYRFVRPVHWVVALHGGAVLNLELLGATAGRQSAGHRFLASGPVTIGHADSYVEAMRSAHVLVEPEARRDALHRALTAAATPLGGEVVPDAALLDEVVELVEWPGVVAGRFDASFLDLPQEILVTTLKHHQKSFSVRSKDGLLPAFLSVANTDRDPAGHVRRGNEWVVVGRLDDARFFWNEDRMRPLASRVDDLKRVTFHKKLGSYEEKTQQVVAIATMLARHVALPSIDVERAVQSAQLAKADLVTGLVGEFPELQGVIGGLLLKEEGGDPIVAEAIADHYRPIGADDSIPRTSVGCIVAMADRLQTIRALLSVGESPTGSRDPFGLRRAANSIFRILIEKRWPIEFNWFLATTKNGEEQRQFWTERLFNFLLDQGFTAPEVRAVLTVGDSGASFNWPLHAVVERLAALRSVRDREDFRTLLLLTRRIHNIVPQVAKLELEWTEAGWLPQPANYEQYEHPEPVARDLRAALEAQQVKVERAAEAGDYATAVVELAALAAPVSKFFDDVLVIDEKSRDDTHHRKELVARLAGLLTRYFDIRELAGQADSNR
jgi:glycyl-tRNA synthetase beta chain